jgi:5-methylcytosine-specific restriction endonuclease McrA
VGSNRFDAIGWLLTATVVFAVAVVVWQAGTDPIPPEERAERVDSFEGNRSSKWPKVRAAHVAKFPRCAACGSLKQLNVHHVKPVWLYPELELQPPNLITLCEQHHYTVGHDPDGPFGPLKPNWKSWNPSVRLHAETMREQAN